MTTVIERLGVRARPGVSPASGTKGDAVSPLVKIMKFDIFSMAAPIVAVGLAAEVLLPYGLLWLSDEFLFDIPDWALWFAFGGPPVAGMATFLGIRKHFFFEKKSKKLLRIDAEFAVMFGLVLQKFFGSSFQKRTPFFLKTSTNPAAPE